ncbi:MAG: glycosyltransferase family protein [Candidatus Omnitrophota bacterium]
MRQDNIVLIIQARMGSKRLPGKVLMEIDGRPLLGHQVKRVGSSALVNRIVIATSISKEDDLIVSFCQQNGIDCFRGSENDVLSRYYECAKQYQADVVVRLTGDCPLSDPELIDKVIDLFYSKGVDYAANTVPPGTRKYPSGLDVEVFSFLALTRAHEEVVNAHDREHVTFYFWKPGHGFKTAQLDSAVDYSKFRVTVDYPEDFEVVSFLVNELKRRHSFGHAGELFEILDKHPDVKSKNSHYYFGIGWNQESARKNS